ncbi:aspartyl-tRNA(Asn)/glutamyl-tRNA(Gln) amidotransferase subunit A [Nocardioides scoriae]|uniref:Aspartyl-tRNA(Asn)/glutamyl-tRNA(Gln) amidotransferase subunit A n=1 Tax=Nocardioides scoriae TaxID=642780 RepID=A0A1H1LZQ0_9ACTN|nr:amidase [Nocardioides scoriae]SDR80088.1 aspartyl-tRNA(Asn)/glutamyl-tRNA(Gln) amidotransferase subunit A [Nocardioides scoriae]
MSSPTSYAVTTGAPTTGLTDLPAREIAALVRLGRVSAREVVAAHLARIAEVDPRLHAVVHLEPHRALAQAIRLDARVRRGLPGGALAGVPVLVKDNIDVAGQTTRAGSEGHDGGLARLDAPVVSRLRAAGAIVLGRTNMDELAMGASTQTSAHGPTRNPVDARRSPGGSSGGSAAAVAAGMVPLALGTDTGGSVREPASQCGVVGLAPSPGLTPMTGVVPFAPDLDRVGTLTRDTGDAALALAVLSGREPAPHRLDAGGVRRLRVGVVTELLDRNQPEVRAALEDWVARLQGLGVAVTPVSVPDAPAALECYTHLSSVAALGSLAPWVRSGRAGEEVLRRWELGRQLLAEQTRLDAAREVRWRLRRQAAQALRQVDVLVSPTMPTVAPLLAGEESARELADPMGAPYTDCWTVVANLAGLAAVSVPAAVGEAGLPVGVMLMGAPGSDEQLLALPRLRP